MQDPLLPCLWGQASADTVPALLLLPYERHELRAALQRAGFARPEEVFTTMLQEQGWHMNMDIALPCMVGAHTYAVWSHPILSQANVFADWQYPITAALVQRSEVARGVFQGAFRCLDEAWWLNDMNKENVNPKAGVV